MRAALRRSDAAGTPDRVSRRGAATLRIPRAGTAPPNGTTTSAGDRARRHRARLRAHDLQRARRALSAHATVRARLPLHVPGRDADRDPDAIALPPPQPDT